MRRRSFLRGVAAGACGCATMMLEHPLKPMFRVARAQSAIGKALIVIFQRGGCDGLNMIVPHGEDEYYNLRSSIAIARPSATNPDSAIRIDDLFGFHPALSSLQSVYGDGRLAIFPTAHYPSASRSHFRGQDWIEQGQPGTGGPDGWLNRHLATASSTASIRAVGIGNELPEALRGNEPVSVFNDLRNFELNLPEEEEELLLDSLNRVYGQTPDSTRAYRDLVHEVGRVVINDLDVISGIDVDNYVPANGAVYPSDVFGRQMQQTAQLIKSGVGLEIAALSLGGWDNHSDQGGANGRQARRLRSLGDAMAALYTDLGTMMDDVVMATMTEFGRTAEKNGSDGTDHGNAAVWTVLGGPTVGGIYGTWPGLAPSQLYRGRYLAHTVDFRDIMADVLTTHLGNDNLAALLPGYTPTTTGVFG